MANEPFEELLHRHAPKFLAGDYRALPRREFRGALHDTAPDRRPLTGKTLPNVPSLSFIPLMKRLGVTATRRTPAGVAAWVKTVTFLLQHLDEDDQRETMQRYHQIPSILGSPTTMRPGFFYTFRYQAAAKTYDRFPLVLVLKRDKTGILGLNFHYLPLVWRFALFEALMPVIAPLPVTHLSRILMTYQRFSTNAKYWYWESTVKRYAFSRVQSQSVFIAPVEWAAALAYPSDFFVHTTVNTVWAKSLLQR